VYIASNIIDIRFNIHKPITSPTQKMSNRLRELLIKKSAHEAHPSRVHFQEKKPKLNQLCSITALTPITKKSKLQANSIFHSKNSSLCTIALSNSYDLKERKLNHKIDNTSRVANTYFPWKKQETRLCLLFPQLRRYHPQPNIRISGRKYLCVAKQEMVSECV
jgi:hypothetical protein